VSLKISVLGSSSSGNCTFISTSKTRVLLDAGLSRRQTLKRLKAIGEKLEDIDALLVSHEHLDHVAGLEQLLAAGPVPLYISAETSEAITGKTKAARVEQIKAGYPFWLGDLKITPFSVPHDAVDPLAFTFEAEGIKIGHVTDLGYMTELVIHRLRGCHVLVLESNHDLEMLRVGSYPWPVKQRIMSRMGHLSNEMTGKFFREEFDGQARHIVLAHLSENNNHPALARMAAAQALESRGFDVPDLCLASKHVPTPTIQV
jgi:phosphoribosyl 1,2-cyclic phosphodiesterase